MLKWVMVNQSKLLATVIIILIIYSIIRLQFPRNQLLSANEIEILITENNNDPILIKDIGNSYTVILYDDVNNNLHYTDIANCT